MGTFERLWGVVVKALLSRQGWWLPGCATSDKLLHLSGSVLEIKVSFSLISFWSVAGLPFARESGS